MEPSEAGRIILLLCVLILVYILTRKVNACRVKRASDFIIKDLEQKGALDPSSAVEISYAKMSIFAMGTRDFGPKALEYLIANNIVGKTDSSNYYKREKSGTS